MLMPSRYHPPELEQIGDRIDACMVHKGVTKSWVQGQLGLHKNALSRYIKGENMPSAEFIAGFCSLLGISTDYLLLGIMPIDADSTNLGVDPRMSTEDLLDIQLQVTELLHSRLSKQR